MATAIFMNSATSLPSENATQSRLPLRRATYVHVSDLTSAYNIDHGRLEQELARAKAEMETQMHDNETPRTPSPDTESQLNPSSQKRLQPPRNGYNLCVLVGKVRIVVDKRRVDSSRVRLAEVEIGDETGTVSLRARDDQIDTLVEVSKRSGAVVLRNCTLELYQGKHIRLAITKWGKLAMYPDSIASTPAPPSKMNRDRNFSKIDLSVVASEMVIDTSDMSYTSRGAWKAPESADSVAGLSSTKSGPAPPKQAQQQAPQGHAAQSSSKRHSRGNDKRPSRGKAQSQYTGTSFQGVQAPQNQALYQGMHGYGRYDPSYGYARQPTMTPASAQQMIFQQQQYEMQQRHYHQMYQGQQLKGHVHPGMAPQGHQVQTSGMVIPSGPTSFAASDDFSVASYATSATDQHSLQTQGMSGMLVPMPAGMPVAASASHQQYGSPQAPKEERHQPKQDTSYASAVTRDLPHQGYSMIPPENAQYYSGKMNPQASSFAPAYIDQATQAPHGYFFDPSQVVSSSYQTVYGHGEAATSKPPGQSTTTDGVPQVTSTDTADSQASGKENFQTGG